MSVIRHGSEVKMNGRLKAYLMAAAAASMFLAPVAQCWTGRGAKTAFEQNDQSPGRSNTAMRLDAQPSFLVAAINSSKPEAVGSSFESEGNRIQCRNVSLVEMLMMAYELHAKQIVGVPDWAKNERFDISGLPDEPGVPNFAQIRSMYRNLLEERFGLVQHRESRLLAVYSLRAESSGSKLKQADPNGIPNTGSRNTASRRTLLFRNMSMADVALNLTFYEDRPVINDTSLPGRYDLTLSWSSDVAVSSEGDAPPSLVTAIREQAGLKLDSVREPVPVLVVDRLQQPSPN